MPPRQQQPMAHQTTPAPSTPSSDTVDESAQPRQTHFWLTNDDIQLMDDWAYQLRRNGWQRATRSSCARALIRLLRQANVDVADVHDEATLLHAIRTALAQDGSTNGM